MAKRIGILSALVTANSAAFTKGLKTAEGSILGFARLGRKTIAAAGERMAASLKGVSIAATVAAAGAGAALTLMVKNSFESIDNLAKAADSLGFTTEQLTGLRHAANLSGVEAEQFDSSIRRMTRTIDAAAMGSAGAAKALDRLGLNALRLRALSTDNQLKAIADQISAIENPTERVAIAMTIFGNEGAKMLNMLSGGAVGLAAMQEEAEALGLSISRIDAAQIEIANDSVSRLQAVFSGVATRIAVELSPLIIAAARQLTGLATEGGRMGQVVTSAVKFVARSVAFLSDVIDLGRIAWKGLQQVGAIAIQGLLYPVEGLAESILGVVTLLSDYLPESLIRGAESFTTAIRDIRADLDSFAASKGAEIDAILVGKSAGERVEAFFDQARRAAEAEAKAIADAAEAKLGKQQEYNDELRKSILLRGKETNLQRKEAPKPRPAQREDLKILVAGTAEAQQFVFDQMARRQESIERKLLEETEDQTDVLEDIRDNTADQEEFVTVYF